jgi:hypothetical protein
MVRPGTGSVKHDTVVTVETGEKRGAGGAVRLASGESLTFAALVLAPGAMWEGPLDFPQGESTLATHLREWRARFEHARGVVLAGGGAVGIGGCLPAILQRKG